jgi:hypothetical protein
MCHKLFHFQVDRAYESKLDERCGFANAFCGKWGQQEKKWKPDPDRGRRPRLPPPKLFPI